MKSESPRMSGRSLSMAAAAHVWAWAVAIAFSWQLDSENWRAFALPITGSAVAFSCIWARVSGLVIVIAIGMVAFSFIAAASLGLLLLPVPVLLFIAIGGSPVVHIRDRLRWRGKNIPFYLVLFVALVFIVAMYAYLVELSIEIWRAIEEE